MSEHGFFHGHTAYGPIPWLEGNADEPEEEEQEEEEQEEECQKKQ